MGGMTLEIQILSETAVREVAGLTCNTKIGCMCGADRGDGREREVMEEEEGIYLLSSLYLCTHRLSTSEHRGWSSYTACSYTAVCGIAACYAL
jgi:hypothetical protein